ncbi:hypothetical protein FKM82_014422 [Ascaphus truei]
MHLVAAVACRLLRAVFDVYVPFDNDTYHKNGGCVTFLCLPFLYTCLCRTFIYINICSVWLGSRRDYNTLHLDVNKMENK